MSRRGAPVLMLVKSTHAVQEIPLHQMNAARSALAHLRPSLKVMSAGDSLEIYKEVGLPRDVAARVELTKMHGTHGIGHTHMATEPAVTTMGTKDGLGVVRDPIACKPAVMAVSNQYVAFGSEYRALVNLPGIDAARVWKPEPATVYFWNH